MKWTANNKLTEPKPMMEKYPDAYIYITRPNFLPMVEQGLQQWDNILCNIFSTVSADTHIQRIPLWLFFISEFDDILFIKS